MAANRLARTVWTPAAVEVLRRRYPHELSADIARDLGVPVKAVHGKANSLGLRKTRETIARIASERMMDPAHPGRRAQFEPGFTPWNKGKPGSTGLHPNTTAHHFRAGQLNGRAAQLEVPVGTLRITKDGILVRKVGTASGPYHHRWTPVHRLVWEAAHGPVPKGHAVVFRAGCKTTDPDRITPEVLELVTRQELMRRNSYHERLPAELGRIVQLRGAITRQINRRLREQQENEAA